MINKVLGNILRALVSTHLKDWDLQLAHAEFTYNRSPSSTTGHTPFEVLYGINPLIPLDLTSLPLDFKPSVDANEKVKQMKKLHEAIRIQIVEANEKIKNKANKHRKPKLFQPGDLVWIHLRKDRFPSKRKSKLAPRADGPFEIVEKVNDNAYKVELPGEYGGVSATFNVGDLSPYLEDDLDLRANPSQPGEDDVNMSPQPLEPTCGDEITRLHENPAQVKEGDSAQALKEIVKLVNGVIKVQELTSTILYGPQVSSPTFECHWAQVKEA